MSDTEKDRRRSNVELVHRYLDAVGTLNLDKLTATLHEEAELVLPYAPPGIPSLTQGKAAFVEFMAAMPRMVSPLNFHAADVLTLEDPDELVAEYRSDARNIATGAPYRNTYIARIRIKEGFIVRYAEFFDPLIFVNVFGEGAEAPAKDSGTLGAEQKFAVHELLNRSSFCFDSRDLDGLMACFTSDATMSVRIVDENAGSFVGRDAIREMMRGTFQVQTDVRRHVISNVLFEGCGDDRVRVVSYLTLLATENGQLRTLSTGTYRDVAVRAGGKWLLAERDLYLDRSYAG